MASCPICGRAIASGGHAPPLPFCSTRCKQVDLGRWLDEGYRLPASDAPESDETDAAPARSPDEDPG